MTGGNHVPHASDALAAISAPRPGWHRRAACRGLDPELFYPARGESLAAPCAVCAACEVASHCLDAALVSGERFGVWAGTSARQRRSIRPTGTKGAAA